MGGAHHRRLRRLRRLAGGARGGRLKIETALVQAEIPVAEIGLEDRVFEAGGIARRIRVFRLPDENPHRRVTFERRIPWPKSGTTRFTSA